MTEDEQKAIITQMKRMQFRLSRGEFGQHAAEIMVPVFINWIAIVQGPADL